jgi:hypothetical protein
MFLPRSFSSRVYVSFLYVCMYCIVLYCIVCMYLNVKYENAITSKYINILIGIVGGGVKLGPLDTAATNRPIMPASGDYDDGEISGMIGMGNRSTRRKPAPVPLCPPQIPHADRTRTRAAAMGSQRLNA